MTRTRLGQNFKNVLTKPRKSAFAITGLQRRLLLLLIVALLPVFGLVIASSANHQRERLAQASENLLNVSQLSALGAERTVEGGRQMLNAITSGPSLKSRGLNPLCHEFLANIRASYRYYTNLGFLGLDGNVICNALSLDPAAHLGDRSYFRQALESGSFAIGEYQIGEITGQPSIHFGMPVYDNQLVLKGVAFAALDLGQLAHSVTTAKPSNISLTMTDRNGTILGTDLLQSGRIGKKYLDEALYTAMKTLPSPTIEARDPEGVLRVYAVSAVFDDSRPVIFVVASIPRDAITAPGERKLIFELFLLALLAALGIVAARWIGNRTLVAPAQRLLKDIHQLAGDSVVGSGRLAKSNDEIVELSSAFNRVASILKLRDVERDASHRELKKARDRVLAAQRIAKIGNWEFDLATRRLWWSEPTYQVFGLTPASFDPSVESLAERFFPEDRERCEVVRDQFISGQAPLDMEYRIVTGDGTVRWVHELGEMELDADGNPKIASGTVQDITDRLRNERLLAAESRALKALFLGMPLKMVLEEVLIGIESILSGARASVHLISPDGTQFQHGVAPHLPPAYCKALEGLAIGPAVGSCGTAAYRREAVIVSDIETDPFWAGYRDLAREHGLRACWSIPVQDASGKVLATFAVYYAVPRKPHPEDLVLAHGAANVIGIAIERDLKEAALRASEQRFRNAFLEAATGMAISTLDGRFLEVNAAYCLMLGYTEQELYSMDIRSVTHPDDWPENKNDLLDLAEGRRESVVAEKRYLTKDGKPLWIRLSTSALCDPNGKPQGFVGIAENINLQREAVAHLREVQNFLDMASKVSRLGAWQVDLPDYRLTWSEEVRVIHELPAGVTPTVEEAINFYAPEHVKNLKKLFDACVLSAVPYDAEFQIITTSGKKVWVRSIGEAVRNAAGQIVRVQGAMQDISARKQAEAEKAALETQLTTTLETISDGFATISRDWRLTFVNTQAEKLLRRSRAEMLGQLLGDVFPVAEGTSFVSNYRKAIQENCAVHFEEFYPPLGLWLDLSVYPSKTGLAIYFRDVTDQRSAKEQLHLLEAAVSRLNDIVLITKAEPIDAPGPCIVFVNDAFERRTGYSREEVIGKSPQILQGPKTQRVELDRIRSALEKWQPVRAELINYTKAGEEFWVELDIVPIADEKGWFTHWVAVERDVTDRKRAEEEILQLNAELEDRVQLRTVQLDAANKELEAFSYSVSHDLRSPLNTVNAFGQLLLKTNQHNLDEKGKHYLSRIRAGTQQMGELIEGLLSLAKLAREPLRLEVVDLSVITQRVEQECREREPERLVQVCIQDDLRVHGDATLLLVVMQNLFGNAWKYTARQSVAKIDIGREAGTGGETIYFVKDNGAGFDMAYANKLFGAFQRLHSPSEFSGTGVGLANVKRVVERHGGRVWAESRPNEGATFYFTLGQEIER